MVPTTLPEKSISQKRKRDGSPKPSPPDTQAISKSSVNGSADTPLVKTKSTSVKGRDEDSKPHLNGVANDVGTANKIAKRARDEDLKLHTNGAASGMGTSSKSAKNGGKHQSITSPKSFYGSTGDSNGKSRKVGSRSFIIFLLGFERGVEILFCCR